MNHPAKAIGPDRTKHLPERSVSQSGVSTDTPVANNQHTAVGKAAPVMSEKAQTTPQEARPLSLTPQERARMNARAARGLVNLVLAQAALLLVTALVSWLVAGGYAALSALAGGLIYLIPSSFAALHMLVKIYSQANTGALTFFWTQALKIGGTLALLALVVRFAGTYLVWPALLIGLVVVLKGYVLLLVLNKLR
jgi:ATP synthase protein I